MSALNPGYIAGDAEKHYDGIYDANSQDDDTSKNVTYKGCIAVPQQSVSGNVAQSSKRQSCARYRDRVRVARNQYAVAAVAWNSTNPDQLEGKVGRLE